MSSWEPTGSSSDQCTRASSIADTAVLVVTVPITHGAACCRNGEPLPEKRRSVLSAHYFNKGMLYRVNRMHGMSL